MPLVPPSETCQVPAEQPPDSPSPSESCAIAMYINFCTGLLSSKHHQVPIYNSKKQLSVHCSEPSVIMKLRGGDGDDTAISSVVKPCSVDGHWWLHMHKTCADEPAQAEFISCGGRESQVTCPPAQKACKLEKIRKWHRHLCTPGGFSIDGHELGQGWGLAYDCTILRWRDYQHKQ